MKTAVSIPDDVFEKVERFAHRAKRSGENRVVMSQGEIRWADRPDPVGSGAGFVVRSHPAMRRFQS